MSKSAKEALKEARDLIAAKDFRAALKCCNRALTIDQNNATALVFIGLCYAEIKENEKAEQAYRKAIKSDSNLLIAWQGLAQFYEKYSNAANKKDELVPIYTKLSELYKDDAKKHFDVTTALYETLMELGNVKEAANVLKKQTEHHADDAAKQKESRSNLVRILSQQASLSDELARDLEDTLHVLLTEDQSVQNMENLKTLIKFLYGRRNLKKLAEVAAKMSNIFPGNAYALEWICKVYLEWASGTLNFESKEMSEAGQFIDKLLAANPNSNLGQLSNAARKWKNGELVAAKKLLTTAFEASSNTNFYGRYILCCCLTELHEHAEAVTAIEAALQLLDKVKEERVRSTMRSKLTLFQVQNLYSQLTDSKVSRALELIRSESAEGLEPSARLLFVKALARCGEAHLATEELGRLEKESLPQHEMELVNGLISVAKNDLDQAKSHFEKCLALCQDNCEALLSVGRMGYDRGQCDESLPWFLKAAKANPSSPVPFLYLGHIYCKLGDSEKARKCYQKCLQLDPQSQEAALALSDVYRDQGSTDANFNLLIAMTKQSTLGGSSSRWAYMRLGMVYLEKEDYTNAILSLQSAIRSDSGDAVAWEALADAYKARGSFNAALKAYDKAVQLRPEESLYPEYQIASIKLILGKYRDAIDLLRSIISRNKSYVPALKSLGEALVAEAYDYLDQHINENAIERSQQALEVLTEAAERKPDVSCVWKLMGEACTLLHPLPEEMLLAFVMPERLRAVEASASEKAPSSRKMTILSLGAKLYTKALQLQPTNASCWHDLAFNYHLRSRLGAADEAQSLRDRARVAAKKAIALEPSSHTHWNALGVLVISEGDCALAQHCFIRSIQTENNAIAWTNLGIMYLLEGHLELANRAFKEAQNQEPSYLRGWVGQALLAEAAGFDEEAMDLFRHTTFLGHELESSVGYSNWVCKTLRSMSQGVQVKGHNRYCIEKMFGVSVAVDCLTRYVDRVRSDSCALNMLGIILEREGLFRSSRLALEASLRNVDASNSSLNLEEHVRMNVARVCFKLSDWPAAQAHYAAVQPQTFESLCGVAVSAYKCGLFADSYSTYQSAMSLASSALQRSHVLAAMASIAYRFQGADAAKTLLFQSCQQRPPSVPGLLALCALGIKLGEMALVQAAMSELAAFGNEAEWVTAIAFVKATMSRLAGSDRGLREIARQAHRFPQVASLWALLAHHVIDTRSSSSEHESLARLQASARFALKAEGLQRQVALGGDWPRQQEATSETSSSHLVVLSHLLSSKEASSRDARVAAAKAVHARPHVADTWCLLVAASRSSWALSCCEAICEAERTRGNSREQMQQWIGNAKRIVTAK